MKTLKNHNGFTLVEMTVVLVIIGLLLAGLLGPIRTQIEVRDRSQGQDELKLIEEAIYGFVINNGNLPCPDTDNDGLENRGAPPNGLCAALEGAIPWVNLGMSQFDPWGNIYQMRIDQTFADTNDGTGCGAATVGVSFELCSNGAMRIDDLPVSGGPLGVCNAGAPGGNQIANNVPLVVYSQGNKLVGTQPLSCYEDENTDNDNEFIFRQFSQHQSNTPANSPTNYFFDDLVIWISPNVLKNKMVQAGRLP